MGTQLRRAEMQPAEPNVVKKRKLSLNDVLRVQRPQDAEAEVVTLTDKTCEEINVGEIGLLPWWPSDMIDEQMSWSMVWLPHWDAEFVGRAYHLLYADVAWDDDIWGLKSIHEIPASGYECNL